MYVCVCVGVCVCVCVWWLFGKLIPTDINIHSQLLGSNAPDHLKVESKITIH